MGHTPFLVVIARVNRVGDSGPRAALDGTLFFAFRHALGLARARAGVKRPGSHAVFVQRADAAAMAS
jgi:hypothetical protein